MYRALAGFFRNFGNPPCCPSHARALESRNAPLASARTHGKRAPLLDGKPQHLAREAQGHPLRPWWRVSVQQGRKAGRAQALNFRPFGLFVALSVGASRRRPSPRPAWTKCRSCRRGRTKPLKPWLSDYGFLDKLERQLYAVARLTPQSAITCSMLAPLRSRCSPTSRIGRPFA